jgi:hypothetical protein
MFPVELLARKEISAPCHGERQHSRQQRGRKKAQGSQLLQSCEHKDRQCDSIDERSFRWALSQEPERQQNHDQGIREEYSQIRSRYCLRPIVWAEGKFKDKKDSDPKRSPYRQPWHESCPTIRRDDHDDRSAAKRQPDA